MRQSVVCKAIQTPGTGPEMHNRTMVVKKYTQPPSSLSSTSGQHEKRPARFPTPYRPGEQHDDPLLLAAVVVVPTTQNNVLHRAGKIWNFAAILVDKHVFLSLETLAHGLSPTRATFSSYPTNIHRHSPSSRRLSQRPPCSAHPRPHDHTIICATPAPPRVLEPTNCWCLTAARR